ncbi:MAG: 5-formyltetrahydrofolate cyclo-ligase [Bacteroidetes bacterium]|jgi:5-formyltetrahydrofolate cyclo-ligase|nr:5-formyltetrahydrofolate cyclo-ligase [Bacteroidota bacterium]
MPTKAALRQHFRAVRAALDDASYAQRSRAITNRVAALPEVEAASIVHAYWPMVAEREADTRPLLRALRAAGKQIVLPVVLRFTREPTDAPRLEHRALTDPSVLQVNRWGLHEPVAGPCVPPEALDIVLVPMLGGDRRGYRLGHGFGYYDEFLHGLTVPTVGLVYEACLVEALPVAPHDVPLRVLVTERRTLRPAADGAESEPTT